jgi:orotidine-5'-phosphate decarboxylase
LLSNNLSDRLYVALDYDNPDDALKLVDLLGDEVRGYKVGMQLYYKSGPLIIERLHRAGCQIFLDLKFHDIPNTVASAASATASLGVSIINVHAAGGLEMMRRAKEAAVETASNKGIQVPLVIAVTQLTSTSQQVMNEQIGIPGTVEEAVVRYAKLAQQAGLDGVVASGHELQAIREACGEQFVTVVPGIRPAWAEANDQKRIFTPADALRQGAHKLVIGRPITQAADPRDAVRRILEEMGGAV